MIPDDLKTMTDAPRVDEWKNHTDAFDRVRAIATTLSQPRSAAYIAEEAHVDERAAQMHLNQLVDVGALQRDDQVEEPVYSSDALYTRMQALRDLLDEYSRDELAKLRDELRVEAEALEGREQDLVDHRLGLVEEAIRLTDRKGALI